MRVSCQTVQLANFDQGEPPSCHLPSLALTRSNSPSSASLHFFSWDPSYDSKLGIPSLLELLCSRACKTNKSRKLVLHCSFFKDNDTSVHPDRTRYVIYSSMQSGTTLKYKSYSKTFLTLQVVQRSSASST
jgi:hypothetical protein